ncbi:hypothetical protein CAPTEDRAFT_229200 [Capitella teleta]|uniref:Uncharacterized protein n=1 Tax=Capitella teleta TaxID=283909 RepID=R7VM40_CAPTE|nr:hypothetical protein CAPTEDRAFT_229200 [Capitella teleta]|eukprot:ELU18175.1 hypothetical protein CAPTEDRAFT_229200 [Capitella teleta]
MASRREVEFAKQKNPDLQSYMKDSGVSTTEYHKAELMELCHNPERQPFSPLSHSQESDNGSVSHTRCSDAEPVGVTSFEFRTRHVGRGYMRTKTALSNPVILTSLSAACQWVADKISASCSRKDDVEVKSISQRECVLTKGALPKDADVMQEKPEKESNGMVYPEGASCQRRPGGGGG